MGKGRKKRKAAAVAAAAAKGARKREQQRIVVADPGKLLALSQRSVNPHEVASSSSASSSLFSSKSRVLLVGEGDFSFALSLTATIGGASLVATSLDTRGEVMKKYGANAQQNIRALRAAGARICHGVDATSRESLDEALGLDGDAVVPREAVSWVWGVWSRVEEEGLALQHRLTPPHPTPSSPHPPTPHRTAPTPHRPTHPILAAL